MLTSLRNAYFGVGLGLNIMFGFVMGKMEFTKEKEFHIMYTKKKVLLILGENNIRHETD